MSMLTFQNADPLDPTNTILRRRENPKRERNGKRAKRLSDAAEIVVVGNSEFGIY